MLSTEIRTDVLDFALTNWIQTRVDNHLNTTNAMTNQVNHNILMFYREK